MNITPVVLCGGSGTRLWPLSRQSLPKQFVPLVGDKSLLRLTLERLAWCGEPALCIASEDHRFLVSDDIERASQHGTVVLEPAHPGERSIEVGPRDDFAVLGVVCGVFRPFFEQEIVRDAEVLAPPSQQVH